MKTLTLLLPVAFFLWLSCTASTAPVADTTGGGSEVEITGLVLTSQGTPAVNATVRVRTADYLSAESRGLGKSVTSTTELTTDASGRFFIKGIPVGHYTIEVTDKQTAAVLMTCEVTASDDSLDLGTHTIAPFATLSGVVHPDSTVGIVDVRIYGLERSSPIDTITGAWSFTDLPQGAFTVRASSLLPEMGAVIVDAPLVASGSSITLPPVALVRFTEENYSQWASSQTIRINTTPSGANISENVYGFPLLIRLSATNFSFASARADGLDIRFAKADGTPLRYEIEQWDAVAREAAIWVRIDTIYGNDSTQSITLHWGPSTLRPDSGATGSGTPIADFSNGAAVFDTANGFAGVWHLNRSNPCADATHNANHMLDGGTQTADGTVDGARYFDGTDSMKTADHASMRTPSFTISCWFRRDGLQTGYNKLACKGDPSFPHQSYTLEIRESSSVAGFQTARVDTSFVTTKTGAVIGNQTWYHLCGTFDAATGIQKLYVDGIPVDSFVNTTPVMFYEPVPWEFYIGAQRYTLNPASFKGWIDEVRIEPVSRSGAWIAMNYENQRIGSKMLQRIF